MKNVKVKTTNFGELHDKLNELIVSEVKAALRLVPEQMYQSPSMCRIVVSDPNEYAPKDIAVDMVWLYHDKLHFDGHLITEIETDNIATFEGGEGDDETEETDWLDITDFQYLIEQLTELMPNGEYDLTNGRNDNTIDISFART